jgi:hypothetical protein
MSFNNLKKNDVVFSESKGSRVFKLISKKDNHWVVGDMFTKKFDTITESDTFRVVKTENKPKPISLLNLVESNGVSIKPTLTEKEVFLIEELKGSYEESSLHEIIERYENGELNSGDDLLKQYLKLLNFNSRLQYDSFALIQYVYCAIENYDTEVSSSTKIDRFKLFELKATEITDERKYQNWTLNVPALDLDMMNKMQSGILNNFWNYDPDAGWADYGDSDFIGMEDIEIEEIGLSEYRKPLVIE